MEKRVLIGCECSGRVRDAFFSYGRGKIEAWSCDFLRSEKFGNHFQGDIFAAILSGGPWDFIGLHPPCTALAVSGNAHYGRGKAKSRQRVEAIKWTSELWKLAVSSSKFVYLENPVGVLHSKGNIFPAPHYIQPWHYGDNASKKTGLYLHNLHPLKRVSELEVMPRIVEGLPRWANQTDSGQNALTPSSTRAAQRAKTYQGLARQMALQWGPLLVDN